MSTICLIIGQAPGRSPGVCLSGRCGRRLAKLAGITLEEFLARTERINLLSEWPGAARSGKGDCFPMAQAKIAGADFLARVVSTRRLTVILGFQTAKAIGIRIPPLTWVDAFHDGGTLIAVSPHPSGVSRWWNSPENVACASSFWRETLRR